MTIVRPPPPKIGTSFTDELLAAGLGPVLDVAGIGWHAQDGTLQFFGSVSQVDQDKARAVLAAHVPVPDIPPPEPSVPAAARWSVSRREVIKRLAAGERWHAMMRVLDGSRIRRELWYATQDIWNDDLEMILILRDAGADPDVILARLDMSMDTSSAPRPQIAIIQH